MSLWPEQVGVAFQNQAFVKHHLLKHLSLPIGSASTLILVRRRDCVGKRVFRFPSHFQTHLNV